MAAEARTLIHDPADFLPSFVWRVNRDGHFRYGNPRVSRYLGGPADELIGLHWKASVRPDDIEQVLDSVRRMRDASAAFPLDAVIVQHRKERVGDVFARLPGFAAASTASMPSTTARS